MKHLRTTHLMLLLSLLLYGSGAMLFAHELLWHNAAGHADHHAANHTHDESTPGDPASNNPGQNCPTCHMLLTLASVGCHTSSATCFILPFADVIYPASMISPQRDDLSLPAVRGPPTSV